MRLFNLQFSSILIISMTGDILLINGYGRNTLCNISQVYNQCNYPMIKRDIRTGRFIDQEYDLDPFKRVKQEELSWSTTNILLKFISSIKYFNLHN